MARTIFEEDKCKGCGLCVEVCPKKILELAQDIINAKGYHPVRNIDMEKCIGCAFCAKMCPDCVITVEK